MTHCWPWRSAHVTCSCWLLRITRFHIPVLTFQLVPFDGWTSLPRRRLHPSCLTLDNFAAQIIWSHFRLRGQTLAYSSLHIHSTIGTEKKHRFYKLCSCLCANSICGFACYADSEIETGWRGEMARAAPSALLSRRRWFEKQTRCIQVAAGSEIILPQLDKDTVYFLKSDSSPECIVNHSLLKANACLLLQRNE